MKEPSENVKIGTGVFLPAKGEQSSSTLLKNTLHFNLFADFQLGTDNSYHN